MADWERLAPPRPGRAVVAFHQQTGDAEFPHEIAFARSPERIGSKDRFALSDAELLALSRRCDEVRALARKARDTLDLMGNRLAQDVGLGRDKAMECACDELESVLASFEDADA